MSKSQTPRVHLLTTHPDEESLTMSVVRRIQDELGTAGIEVSSENIATSGFSVEFSMDDLKSYRTFLDGDHTREVPADVAAQQRIIEASDVLVIVFPVYWWSFPVQLKGWVDRVLTGGWSWGIKRSGRAESALARLRVHLVPLAGAEADFFEDEGYRKAIETQIEKGVFDYTHTGHAEWTWMWNAADRPIETLDRAAAVGKAIAADLS